MSVLAQHAPPSTTLSDEVAAHLEAQLSSARRLLEIVLAQGAAIRQHDVPTVVQLTGVLQAELARRTAIESERARLLDLAGSRLGINPADVTLARLIEVLEPGDAAPAAARCAELRGLLEEVKREHYCNRVLMHQELAFLDHLLGLAQADRKLGYDADGRPESATPGRGERHHRVLDLEA